MEQRVKILVLEDVATDAELELHELRRSGMKIDARVVETEEEFRRHLEDFEPDVIISDFSLPQFNGLVALSITRELRPDTPFLFVSGTIGEELAVSALKSGATDYLLKNNLKRFAAAVQRALEEARERQARRRAEERARSAEYYFSLFMRHLPATAFAKDLQGRFVFVNPRFEELLGRPDGQMLGLTTRDLYPAEYAEEILANDRKVIDSKQPYGGVEKLKLGTSERFYLVNKFPIVDEAGEVTMLGGISVDITERLEAEKALAESEERFRGIVETTEERIWECDLQCRMTYNNPALTRILGYRPEEVAGKSPLEFLDEEDRKTLKRTVRLMSTRKSGWRGVTVKARHKDGGIRWLESNGRPLFAADGTLVGFRGADRDVTDRILQERRLKRLSRIRDVLGNLTAAIIRLRTREEIFSELCRIAVEVGEFRMAWIGMLDQSALSIRPLASHGFVEGFIDVLGLSTGGTDERGESLATLAIRQRRQIVVNDIGSSDLAPHWKREALARGYRSGAALPLACGGKVVGVAVLFSGEPGFFDDEQSRLLADLASDVSLALERMEKQEQLDYLSYYDPLTGLANRTLLLERLQTFLHEAARGERFVAFMILDVERFRNINESLGRGAGDNLLKLLAGRLRSHHEADRVGRLGMNSFAVVLPNVPDELHTARLVDEGCKNLFSNPFSLEGQDLRVTARCGVAVFPADGGDPEALARNAEAALAQAKRTGDPTVFYTPKLNADVARRLALENKLRRAVEERQFVLHYQPKVSLETGVVEGVEALIRWNDPDSGLVPPSQFIPVLEETGMILEVGQWALGEAANVYRKWKNIGRKIPRIAVNVSPIQLRQKDFARKVEEAVNSGNGATGIDIEITETTVMHDVRRSMIILEAIRDLGIMIAMDDFGTGYSSLSYLARLPIDYLKIDRSFIHKLVDNHDNLAIASAIVSMARSLGLQTIAEGVETREQVDLLKALGCHQMQGYYFSRPVPEDRLIEILAA